MALTPEIPMVNAGVLYINGLQLSNNATTPLTLLNVAAGACRDSTNTNDIVISSNLVLNLAASGVLGLDTGAVAANTMYAVYAIGSSTNQIGNGQPFSAFPGSVVLSTSFVRPYLPAGYDMFRRIGAVVTSGASQFVVFAQTGTSNSRKMIYGIPRATSITAGNAVVYTAIGLNAVAPTVPAVAGVTAFFRAALTPTAAGNQVFLYSVAGASTTLSLDAVSGDVAAVAHTATISCPIAVTAGVANAAYRVSAGGDAVALPVSGYEDVL